MENPNSVSELTDGSLGVTFAVKPDESRAALLHLSVLNLPTMREQLPQVLKTVKEKKLV
jgi:hypothetical protein